MKATYLRGLFTGLVLCVMFNINLSAQTDAEATTIIKNGDTAPDFTVTMLDGRSLKLQDLKGKVVLINFWATWCGPCMEEFKVIPEKIVKRFEGKDFVFLPISRQETREAVQKKMEQLKESGIDFPVGLDPDKSIYSKYATTYIPRNFLIDKNGKVVYTSVGYDEKEFARLVEKIEELIKIK
jgi:Thiol-disulfide isomerase and thioredoxins